jgi:hypothetical protein
MTSRTVGDEAGAVSAQSMSFERFAGVCAILAGVSGFLYAVAFVVLQDALLSGLFLMLSGLFTTAALVAVYEGSAVHGGYDLANVINPPVSLPDLPNPVDPRGLLTFGVAGVALFVVAWLIGRGGRLPKGLGYLGYASAILLLALYLGRLIVLDPTSPLILGPALLNGFLVNPIFYVWIGLALLRGRST